LWLEEAREPLLKAGRTLLASGNVQQVRTGAFVIESIGVPADGPRVLEAFGPVLRDVHDREKPDENILENPGAADALIAALAGLRERGYRAPDSGGVEVILAQFLQWGDPAMPRRRGWEDTLEAFMSQRPALLREVGLRALPSPPDGRWEKVLLKALDDRDRGVMRAACEVAGASGNPRFVEALANIVRGEQHEWVVGSASEALLKLGARAAAADAWIERLADAKLYPAALRFLAKTLEHPATSSSSGRTDASREARFALREKWRRFFTDPERMALVQAGKPVPVTEDQARDLFGGVFAFDLEGNRKWPGLSSVSPAGSDPAPPPPR
jgi:hypothetical protein